MADSDEHDPEVPAKDQPDPKSSDSVDPEVKGDRTVPIRLVPDAAGRFNLKRTQLPQSKPMTGVDPKAPTPLPFQLDETPIQGSPVVNAQEETRVYRGDEATMVGQVPAKDPKDETYSGAEDTVVGKLSGADVIAPVDPDAPYTGAEMTQVGAPIDPAIKPGVYQGTEATMVPTSKPASDEPYTGNEATMVGMPTGPKPMGLQSTGPWMGNEATAVGMPVDPAVQSLVDKVSTPQGKSPTKTTATMDDGWHLKGRKGAMTGQVFGDYEIGGILGEGGMGVVYRARQISLKRRVALKVLPPALSNDMRLRERFEAEARTASLINSPHVVSVFAAGTIDDICFFVMEFVEGIDLNEVIKEREEKKEQFAFEEAADYIIQAARGLSEAGKIGIVHRDIKPANLMVTSKGVVKIADFGISKVAGEHGLTMTGTAVGTPAYCSPEQGRGDPVDPRSDLYSLGVVLYELLVGQKPFDGATANALIYQHNYAEPKLPKEVRADLPDEYQAIALKCLQKDPANRYQDAAELAGDLERVRAGSAPMTALLSAFGTGADEAMRRLGIKQKKTWPYVLAATLVLGGMGGGYWWWQAGEGIRQERKDLRVKLATAIDAAAELEDWVPDDLARYEGMVSSNDPDLLRWHAELTEVEALKERLGELDRVGIPDLALRSRSELDLVEYAKYVGSDGVTYQRWQTKVAQATAREGELRNELRTAIDQSKGLTLAACEELDPQVKTFRLLAGAEDADGLRWDGRLVAVRERVAALKVSLARYDTAAEGIPVRDLAVLASDLKAYEALVGTGDPQVQQWTTAQSTAQAVLNGLTESLARLDQAAVDGLVPQSTVSLVSKDLDRYGALADPDDAQLRRWRDLVGTSNARVETLRQQLSRLDEPELLTQVEQKAFLSVLNAYAILVGQADHGYQTWSRRLAKEEARIGTDRQALSRLDDSRRLTLVEVTQLTAALDRLEASAAIEPVRAQSARGTIAASRQYIEGLRAMIAAREGADGFKLDKDLGERILEFVDLAGVDDSDAKRWRTTAAEYFRLHEALVVLDESLPIPDKIDGLLVDYAGIVGEDEDVRRWRAKVIRVRQLKDELAAMNLLTPMPENALERSAELYALVGDQDLDAPRWKTKSERVTALVAGLQKDLLDPPAVVLNVDRVRQDANDIRELVFTQVGREDEVVDALALREAILEGPPRPIWAEEFARDRYGLYATLVVGQQRLRFRYIPAGTVSVGSPEREAGRGADEGLQPMTLTRSFWLAETETTQSFWDAFGIAQPSRFPGAERPVERVSWADCSTFLNVMNGKITGMNARLPSEMEWEFACRAGDAGPYHGHNGTVEASGLSELAWFVSNSGDSTHPVAGRFPNRLGLFDLHGNVWEWCEDTYVPYSSAMTVDRLGRGGRDRVVRGGCWADKADRLRAANRLGIDPELRTLYVGFRIAAPVEWPDDNGYEVLRKLRRGLVIRDNEATDDPVEAVSPEGDPTAKPPADEEGAIPAAQQPEAAMPNEPDEESAAVPPAESVSSVVSPAVAAPTPEPSVAVPAATTPIFEPILP